jgi:proteasome lid subunit RPN8/RPN11
VTWTVRAPALAAAVAAARAARPAECCGVLIGVPGEVREAIPGRNLSSDPNRFLLDPKDHIAARRAARQRQLQVVGFFHSHPHSSPRPSPADVADDAYPGALHLIVGFSGERSQVGLFEYGNGNFHEIAFVTDA